MNAAHIHLLLNHVPVLGAVFGLIVLGYGYVRRGDDVMRAGLWLLVIVGVTGGIVYLTGEPAEELVEGLAGVSEAVLERHEAAALWATIGAGFVGLVALVGLVRWRAAELPHRYAGAVLALTLGLTGLMGWTANLGGQVQHAEIRSGNAGTVETDGAEAREHDSAAVEPGASQVIVRLPIARPATRPTRPVPSASSGRTAKINPDVDEPVAVPAQSDHQAR